VTVEDEQTVKVTLTTPGMETVGEVVERAFGFGNPGDWPTCGRCGGSFPRLIEGDGRVPVCQGCQTGQARREVLNEEIGRITSRMDRWIASWLRRAGLSDREARADLGRIPERLQRALPPGTVANMTSGIVPLWGFGLYGPTGTGKTFTLAALVRKMAEVRIAGRVSTLGKQAFDPWLSWVSWPELVNRLRVLASRDGGVAEGDEIMARLSQVEALVLDDLGAERWKTEDWVGSLLDLLVDARYKAEKPTFYSAHLVPEEMREQYGTRLWSRLTGDNPLIEVVPGPDLRIVR
jgi:hypothetical protein